MALLRVAGVIQAMVANLLQVQQNVTQFPNKVIANISFALWVPICRGMAATVVSLLCPYSESQNSMKFSSRSGPSKRERMLLS
ncbi:insulin-induced protein [Cricetulus griseus]|uniref:Insulin-induced gene 1 protein n=1 Tax=Cricetulus griseus TaxID=10029 RepID=A0A061IIW6_CRIGR|nr:insulin-induced protein [Cricetulus griseus]